MIGRVDDHRERDMWRLKCRSQLNGMCQQEEAVETVKSSSVPAFEN
jgi:hypothetical protein